MNLLKFYGELRRRNVFKVAGVYAAVAWLIIQITAITFPIFDIPDWGVRFVISLVFLGFPLAIIFAWAFELTPEGLKRTEDVPLEESITKTTGKKLNITLIMLLSIAVIFLSYEHYLRKEIRVTAEYKNDSSISDSIIIPHNSIAVLPFENMSTDTVNSYFAEGLRSQIITRLTNLKDIKVIARKSSNYYPSHPKDLKMVAHELGVNTVLEGNVQKFQNEVLVNVQLINTRTSIPIWAMSFQRTLNNEFKIEIEVAQKIALALKSQFTTSEQQRITDIPTINTKAYNAYLKGLALQSHDYWEYGVLENAVIYFRKAIKEDPNFALAWARLSLAEGTIYFLYDHTQERLESVKKSVLMAKKIDPMSGVTYQAIGHYHYIKRDYEEAKIALKKAISLSPNNVDVKVGLGLTERRLGNWNEALKYFKQATILNPLHMGLLGLYAYTALALRDYEETLKITDRALALCENGCLNIARNDILTIKASVYMAKGDLNKAGIVLAKTKSVYDDPDPLTLYIIVYQNLLTRDYETVIKKLRKYLNKSGPEFEDPIMLIIFNSLLGFTEKLAGSKSESRKAYLKALTLINTLLKKMPNNAHIYSFLGLVEAGLGHKDRALAAGHKTLDLLPVKNDALDGPKNEELMAKIEVQVGEFDKAIPRIRHLLTIPYYIPLTPAFLRFDPIWDPIRKDPRFQTLLDERES
jgi:TolB-like protein